MLCKEAIKTTFPWLGAKWEGPNSSVARWIRSSDFSFCTISSWLFNCSVRGKFQAAAIKGICNDCDVFICIPTMPIWLRLRVNWPNFFLNTAVSRVQWLIVIHHAQRANLSELTFQPWLLLFHLSELVPNQILSTTRGTGKAPSNVPSPKCPTVKRTRLFFIKLMVWYWYHLWLMVSKCFKFNQNLWGSITQNAASQRKGSSPSCASLTCASNRASVAKVTYHLDMPVPATWTLGTGGALSSVIFLHFPTSNSCRSHGSESKSMQLVGCPCLLQSLFGFTAFGRILSVAVWLEWIVCRDRNPPFAPSDIYVICLLVAIIYAPCHAMPFRNIWSSGDMLTRNSEVSRCLQLDKRSGKALSSSGVIRLLGHCFQSCNLDCRGRFAWSQITPSMKDIWCRPFIP